MGLGSGQCQFSSLVLMRQVIILTYVKATPFDPNPPPKVHEKAILWTEHHPDVNELLTASADGSIILWGQ